MEVGRIGEAEGLARAAGGPERGEERESAEAERRGSRSGEEEVTESSSCSATRSTRSSENPGAARPREADAWAAGQRNRKSGGGARRGVEQEAARGGDGMASAKFLPSVAERGISVVVVVAAGIWEVG
jgi:hypothetical protein